MVDKQFIFNDQEKEFFRRTMRKLEAFHGIRVVTYCLLSNHFHLLIEVPDPRDVEPLTTSELLRRMEVLYDDFQVLHLRQELERAAEFGDDQWEQEILARYEDRIGDFSKFIKELKQRFTQWYNRKNGRKGTLWEDRFKSVLVEDSEKALLTMAAYIDLNPVRAGMVSDPKDYRWCGYAEAVAGGKRARRGLGRILEEGLWMTGEEFQADWRRTGARYRLLLFGKGEGREADAETGARAKRGFSEEEIDAQHEREGQLSTAQVLRCRVRYFCDGAVFGSTEFVNRVFQSNRDRYGPKRKTGARRMRGADFGELRTLRDLRVDVIQSG